MRQPRLVLSRFLAVLVALYGVMSACICTDHAPSQVARAACHHCPSSAVTIDAAAPQIASHHQCCGMERAPMAVEKVVSPSPTTSDHNIVLPTATLFVEPNAAGVAVSRLSHAPPGVMKIYLTTQRFLI